MGEVFELLPSCSLTTQPDGDSLAPTDDALVIPFEKPLARRSKELHAAITELLSIMTRYKTHKGLCDATKTLTGNCDDNSTAVMFAFLIKKYQPLLSYDNFEVSVQHGDDDIIQALLELLLADNAPNADKDRVYQSLCALRCRQLDAIMASGLTDDSGGLWAEVLNICAPLPDNVIPFRQLPTSEGTVTI